LIAIENMVVKIPGTVQHQSTLSITEEGHSTSRTRELIPKFQRITRIITDTTNPTTLPTKAVLLTLIAMVKVLVRPSS
jgi:hypothetical protein